MHVKDIHGFQHSLHHQSQQHITMPMLQPVNNHLPNVSLAYMVLRNTVKALTLAQVDSGHGTARSFPAHRSTTASTQPQTTPEHVKLRPHTRAAKQSIQHANAAIEVSTCIAGFIAGLPLPGTATPIGGLTAPGAPGIKAGSPPIIPGDWWDGGPIDCP